MNRFDKILLGMTGAFMSLAIAIYGVSMYKSDKNYKTALRDLNDLANKSIQPNDSKPNPNE